MQPAFANLATKATLALNKGSGRHEALSAPGAGAALLYAGAAPLFALRELLKQAKRKRGCIKQVNRVNRLYNGRT
jgi:hypothetical protein